MPPDLARRAAAVAVAAFETAQPLTPAMRRHLTDLITARLMVEIEPAPAWNPEAPTAPDARSL